MPKVNPKILEWARTTTGLTVEEASAKLALKPERLAALELGEREPSRRQLVNMAEKYRRPLLAFYLPDPPRTGERGQDFRTLPEGRAGGAEALLDALLRNVRTRQALVRAALEEAEEADPAPFVGSAQMAAGVDALVAQMRETLKVKLEDFRKQKTLGDAFALLRSAAERAGVFVLLMGNLGTYHTDLPPRVFRGFAIADNIAPFVVINETDARAAWSFTLLHELAHIWLGQTGVSGYEGEAAVEKFCDAVAARFLLSADEVGAFKISNGMSFNDLRGALEDFAIERNVSRKMVAYNFLQAGKINLQMYRRLSDAFDAARTAMEKAQPKGDSSGPDYYVVRRHRVGAALLDFASRMLASGVLNTTKASKVLGVKPTSVDQLISAKRAA